MDPSRRTKYDSNLEFDDTIPTKKDFTEKTFYDVMNMYFNRNSRFSTIKPVPNVGDANTPMDEVRKFYLFWDEFKTWREFTKHDEHDPDEAEDRYEKRWME